jgi:hypothetical protein
MLSTFSVASRTMRTSTSPWSSSRWFNRSTDEPKRTPCLTASRSRSIERSGVRPRADGQPRVDAHPQRRDLRRVEREFIGHVVDDGDQVVLRVLDARRARALLQRLEELRRERQVGLHPRLRGGRGEVEMQPDEGRIAGRLLQPLDGLGQVDRLAAFGRREAVAAQQAVLLGSVSDGHGRSSCDACAATRDENTA